MRPTLPDRLAMYSAGALARMERDERRGLLGGLDAVYVPDSDHGDGLGFTHVRIAPDVLADLSEMHWRGAFVSLHLGVKWSARIDDFVFHASAFDMVVGDAAASPRFRPWWWARASRVLADVGVIVGREANRREGVPEDACTVIAATPDSWGRGEADPARFWTPADALAEGYVPLLIDQEAREVRRIGT